MSSHGMARRAGIMRRNGKPVLRKEDQRLLVGAGCYSDDVNLPGQAHASFVRSPHAHARIGSIDTAAALATPGVIAVLTGGAGDRGDGGVLESFAGRTGSRLEEGHASAESGGLVELDPVHDHLAGHGPAVRCPALDDLVGRLAKGLVGVDGVGRGLGQLGGFHIRAEHR